jgi:hypothetical protein
LLEAVVGAAVLKSRPFDSSEVRSAQDDKLYFERLPARLKGASI